MKMIIKSLAFAVLLSSISCQKNNVTAVDPENNKKIVVYLTDAPATYDKVNIDVTGVKINYEDAPDKWISLNTYNGIYDLLLLQNGVSVIIATGNIATNHIKEIRLELGTNNSIVINGISKPLTIPSGAENGLKLKFPATETLNFESLLIDFDAALSIHKQGQGNYILRPVLKLKQKS